MDIDRLEKVPTDLNRLKSKASKLDIDELKTNPVDLSKLSDEVRNEVVEKTVYNELVKKHKTIQKNITKIN